MGGEVLALSGGVGGAKLSLGLDRVLPAGALHVLANTADDFEHLGLTICPDIDTLLYTLSGRANREQGWGLEGESWNAMQALEALGGETWFRLGDRDLATHLWRSTRLAAGECLSQVTAGLAQRLGLRSHVLPMSETPVRTLVDTDEGELPFQHYFVRRRCEPAVRGFRFAGLDAAQPPPALRELLASPALEKIVICPSNPFVSVDPILQTGELWRALRDAPAPVVAVSPIVAGLALKGPAAKMMAELQIPATALGVAAHYAQAYPGLIDYFVIDSSDATLSTGIDQLGLRSIVADTIMTTTNDKERLARYCLALEGV
ncbi:2-phospho-L-lactate transferase [Mangrovimicrobium sediminis]|uniref:2-phospho-L-lactate transferase n=1 Tax=Mangrovimicrobium sediminis TaxID=2562682 RepID=A0A4Z0M5A7_9GAMM|nr:2-phospho-L-lactate transferase [Haliea sp. SAOS-164]TGD74568.1 2-phospho-L-lactate transferase [Haliea sp. SAOS-164]